MLLDKLEIRGFKSFGDKVAFHFHEGVTGVVGPNGCGKSNVVDAIRWVLGEQRARALRSDRMDNVIFNGTRHRKPLQMAEVAITFKNTRNLLPTQYTEVTITRRFYRSGDSEYLLNGVICRLKDIQNLFMDTGIGANSYAIIELKMVDEILNDQNNSRRGLFEEAAGISKFKQRKKESLRKLEDTDTDLARVEDLLFEINKNLKTLEKQAKQAQIYIKLKEEYKEAHISLGVLSAGAQLKSIRVLEQQIAQEENKIAELTAQIALAESELERLEQQLLSKEKLLQSRQKTLNEHQEKIRQIESESKIKQTRLKFLQERLYTLQQYIEQDSQSTQRAKHAIEGLIKEKETTQKQLREAKFLLNQYEQNTNEKKQHLQTKKKQLAEAEQQLRNQQNILYQLRKTIEINQVQINTLKQELERDGSVNSQQSAFLEIFETKINDLEALLHQQQHEFRAKEQQENYLKQEINKLEQTLRTLQDEIGAVNRKYDAKQNEYQLTKSMVDNLEGFPQALVMLKKQWVNGKNTVSFADIITTEEKYRIAIENFLEPYLNFLIVETEVLAIEAIQLLAESGKGKAYFFVLDKLKQLPPKSQLPQKSLPDFIRPVISIVEYDKKYAALVHKLLQDVYINTKPTDMTLLPFGLGKEDTLINLNGKIIIRPDSLSGGSVGLFEGKKIGRAKNLEKLAFDIEQVQNKMNQLNDSIADVSIRADVFRKQLLGDTLIQLKDNINLTAQELATIRAKKEQSLGLLQASENKREQITEQIALLTENKETTKPQIAETESIIETLMAQIEIFKTETEQEAQQSALLSTQYNQQNILFYQIQNKIESLTKEIEYKQTTYEQALARLTSNRAEAAHIQEEITALLETYNDNDEVIKELYEEKKRIANGVLDAEKDYYTTRGQINEAEKTARNLRIQRENNNALMMQLHQKITEKKMQTEAVKERLLTEFEVHLSDKLEKPLPTRFAEYTEDMLRTELQQIRKRMDTLGAINYTAIEAFEEVKQRYDFITNQRNDLLEAKTSLQATISEIETVARENFMSAFQAISTHFKAVFRSLFTPEDSCDLKLVNPEAPLESPIDIIACPKGKRPLTINQLSGGEKTLTAIALLFAIYLIKPAPFCIFDEVDAPLDDANIDKFNNIIRKFSQNSQFIIVTHNKRTMLHTDIMYGVTMLEQGVSTVVPVSLKDLK